MRDSTQKDTELEHQNSDSQNLAVTLQNEHLRIVVEIDDGLVGESYYVLHEGRPSLMARNAASGGVGATYFAAEPDNGNRGHVAADFPALFADAAQGKRAFEDLPRRPEPGPLAPACAITHASHTFTGEDGAQQTLTLYGKTVDGDCVERRFTLCPGEPFCHIEVALDLKRDVLLERLEDRFYFMAEGPPDFTWTPLLKAHEENVCPDWSCKAPAMIVQEGDLALALVPDVNHILANDTWRVCNLTMDIDARTTPGPALAFGLSPTVFDGHSLFKHTPGQRALLKPSNVSYAYYFGAALSQEPRQVHRGVVHFLWERFGHDAFLRGHAAQQHSFHEWANRTWKDFANEMWYETERNGVVCGSIKIHAFFETNAWFCAWWNNMRTACALALYARRSGDRPARDKADKILNMALDAPRHQGAFPVVFTATEGEGALWRRDHPFGGIEECYHAFDMAWTSYWLLKWHNEIDPEDGRVLPNCIALGDFLCRNQQDSGFIPSFYNADLEPRKGCGLNKESAEPAACAVFLLELYRTTQTAPYLDAAIKAIEYVQHAIVPKAKWFDYETFLSCSPKPYDFYDAITMQYPQNNMATIQTAKAMLAAHEITGEERFLKWGLNVLDYLSLTQQVWSHPLMTPNLIGGFTTQNTDAEWSDARQAYCAVVYLDYFECCGKLEYLERGIAALRSSFAVAPYENWSHVGFFDGPGALSGFHWGQGSAMASVEFVWDRYGDLCVDLKDKWAYGINGCTADFEAFDGRALSLGIVTDILSGTSARIVFRNVPDTQIDLDVNGRRVGRFDASDLRDGVCVSL